MAVRAEVGGEKSPHITRLGARNPTGPGIEPILRKFFDGCGNPEGPPGPMLQSSVGVVLLEW